MNIEKTVDEVTFDLVSCLTLIGADESLLSLYNQKFNTDLKLMIRYAKNGEIDSDSEKYIRGVFDNVIVKRREYFNSYTDIFLRVTQDTITGSETPRRYGKTKILADITEQGGKSTEIQRMMLEVNDLKNIVAKLNRRGKAQIIGNTELLTDKQCREVIGVIQTLKNKLKKENIL